MEHPDEPPCETESAEFCSTTITKSETLIGTSTSTITKTESGCETMYGCHMTDVGATTTVSTGVACAPTDNPETYDPQKPGCPAPAIVYPRNPENVGNIPQILAAYSDVVPVGLSSEQWTAFYWVPYLGVDTMAELRASPDVRFAYYYEEYNNNVGTSVYEEDGEEEGKDPDTFYPARVPDSVMVPHSRLTDSLVDVGADLDTDVDPLNDTIVQQTHWNELRADQFHIPRETEFWSASQVSLPKDSIWGSPGSNSFDPTKPDDKRYTYNYDIADASDTYVYVLNEDGVWNNHQVRLYPFPGVQNLIQFDSDASAICRSSWEESSSTLPRVATSDPKRRMKTWPTSTVLGWQLRSTVTSSASAHHALW